MAGSKWDDLKKKGENLVSSVEKNPQVKEVRAQAMKNPKEVLLGALVVLGFLFSYYWFGSLVVGVAAGLFAPWTIKDLLTRAENYYNTVDKLTAFMWAATIIFFLFHTFWFAVGAVVATTIKLFFPKPGATSSRKKEKSS